MIVAASAGNFLDVVIHSRILEGHRTEVISPRVRPAIVCGFRWDGANQSLSVRPAPAPARDAAVAGA